MYEYHTPVLLREAAEYVSSRPDGIIVDGTLGGGGHAERILSSLSPKGKLVVFDQDLEAIVVARQRLSLHDDRIMFVQNNFIHLRTELQRRGIEAVDGILFDLGVSSRHLDSPERGFSFQHDARLDMRMNRAQTLDAWMVVNSYDELQLAGLFWNFGEERSSRRIARAIIRRRQTKPIETTLELAAVIRSELHQPMITKTLARVFQSIRIEVNHELENLRIALADALEILKPGGRLVVISYHSLEDRIVKNFFNGEAARVRKSGHALIEDQRLHPRLTLLTRKPVTASEEEQSRNPRARSAKLRAAERLG